VTEGSLEQHLRDLDSAALDLLAGGRTDSAVPDPDRFSTADFSNHPWAELVVAAALAHARRDADAESRLSEAEQRFRQLEDRRGLGWVRFVRATMALGRGQLDRLADHLDHVRVLLDGDDRFPADGLAHLGLVAFYRGDVREATLLAEQALGLARSTGNRRHEGTALVYLGYFEFWRGRFARVERLADAAEDIYADMPDPHDAFELPLVLALRAALHAVRGNMEQADAQYDAALRAAVDLGIEWFEAIVLAQRSHFMGTFEPRRSRNDARRSFDRLVEMGDEWWQVWALRAQGIVETALGNHGSAQSVLTRALDRSPGPQERALTLIALGNDRLEAGDPIGAAESLKESIAAAQEVDVAYLVAWAASVLARAEPDHAEEWFQVVREHDDGDAAYEQLLQTDLRVAMLGDAGVWRASAPLRFATRHAEAALYSLALADDHTLHDEVLAERLWPDAAADRVGGRLATVVWQIRRGLGPDAWRLRRQNGLVSLDCRGVDLDVDSLRSAATKLLTAPEVNVPAVEATVASLSRPLLSGFQYESWVQHHAGELATLAARLERVLPR